MKLLYFWGFIGLSMVFQANSLFATPQMSDTFIYNGLRYGLNDKYRHENRVYPMENFFERFPQKRPQPNIVNPQLSRGYLATFEITENELWVVSIRVHDSTTRAGHRMAEWWTNVISEIFEDQNRVKVDWFTGVFIIPERERWSQSQNYLLIEIENGNVIRELTLSGRERYIWSMRFELFGNSDAYQRVLDESREMPSELFLEFFIRSCEMEYMCTISENELSK
ncbi:MAG: hypothetical protein LBU89_04405 [Fibromonadaceae bacterium]|jgi:hypothetical protein|nr:hypothetical protein [Fibromonadaceae bacterium]